MTGIFASVLPLSFISTGSGTSFLPDTVLPGETVALSGRTHAPAIASPAVSALRLAAYVGDAVTQALTIANTASGDLTDVLDGGFAIVSAGFTGNGTLAGVVAGASGTLSVGINTGQAGVFSDRRSSSRSAMTPT